MTDNKYQPGDVLENILEINEYTLIVERPSPHSDGSYLVLDLILRPVKEKAGEESTFTFEIPKEALRMSYDIDPSDLFRTFNLSHALYRKIDHIDLKQKGSELIRLVGARIPMDIPELEKYLRVDRNY